MDKLEKLERLQKLRESGALSEEEFSNQKRSVLEESHDTYKGDSKVEITDDDIKRDYAIRGRKKFNSYASIIIVLIFTYLMISNDVKKPETAFDWAFVFGVLGCLWFIFSFLYEKVPIVAVPLISISIGLVGYNIFAFILSDNIGILAGISLFLGCMTHGFRGSSFFNRRIRNTDNDDTIEEWGTEPSGWTEAELQTSSEASEVRDQADIQDFVAVDEENLDWETPEKSKSIWLVGILSLALIAGILSWFIWGRDTQQAEMVDVVVTGPANARDRPTTVDSKIAAKFDKGEELTGRWIKGTTDSNEQWLEFESGGKVLYIWKGNLKNLSKDASNSEQSITSSHLDIRDSALDSIIDLELQGLASCSNFDGTSCSEIEQSKWVDRYSGKSVNMVQLPFPFGNLEMEGPFYRYKNMVCSNLSDLEYRFTSSSLSNFEKLNYTRKLKSEMNNYGKVYCASFTKINENTFRFEAYTGWDVNELQKNEELSGDTVTYGPMGQFKLRNIDL